MSLKINGLSKRFDNRWILRDVSLEIEKGQISGIVGPSGSGKSTLLRILAGKLSPNGGSIHLGGSESRNVPTGKDISFLSTTVNKPLIASFLSVAKEEPAGEQQRRRFEAVIENSGSLLLLDNPFRLMDQESRDASFALLRSAVREKGLTVLFATNDFQEALLLCDSGAILLGGEIRQSGTPQEIYQSPKSQAVARFTVRNNVFEARRLTSSKAEIQEFQTISGGHRLFAGRAELAALGPLNQNVGLAIRPEHISISFGASFPEDNLLKGLVTEVRFLGPTTSISLDADGLSIDATVLRLVGLDVGDECMVGLPLDRIHILSK